MKKILLATLLVLSIALIAACGDGGGGGGSDGATSMEFWTFQELHVEFFDTMMQNWNEQNPDRQIDFDFVPLPYDDMHNRLLISLQAGEGAPDMVDIEIGKFANFLRGDIQMVPINRVVEPELNNIVRSRVDIYAKDGNFYGVCFHIGAAVIYYNEEALTEAGIDWRTIKTWDDYYEAGKKFAETTGKAWSTMEINDPWHMWPLLSSQGGDLLAPDGTPNISSPQMVRALEYNQKLLQEGISIVTPGDNQHSEAFYGLMNGGGVGSVIMPMWYMGRFTDYMPDLNGKIAIAPLPVWEVGQPRSVGLGGTGTVVTAQSESPDLAMDYLAYAKLSTEGNVEIWKLMGFDPIRTETWTMPELRDARPNKFLDYFSTNPFDVLLEVINEIPAITVSEALPPTMDHMKNSVYYLTYVDMVTDIAAMLAEEQAKIQY